jgi:hypothetical protein
MKQSLEEKKLLLKREGEGMSDRLQSLMDNHSHINSSLRIADEIIS